MNIVFHAMWVLAIAMAVGAGAIFGWCGLVLLVWQRDAVRRAV
ncbi:hypothetical protein [Acetobacter fallax]|nr:hypothetical protein [Acetobacter fallax]